MVGCLHSSGTALSLFFQWQLLVLTQKEAMRRHGHQSNGRATSSDDARLLVSDKWVLFARPRSQHVVLQDIDRLREAAKDATHPISGLAERTRYRAVDGATGKRDGSLSVMRIGEPASRPNVPPRKSMPSTCSFPSHSTTTKSKSCAVFRVGMAWSSKVRPERERHIP